MTIDEKALRSNSAVMEAFQELRLDQDVSDRAKYLDLAMEAAASPNGQLLNKLYRDILEHSDIDFGKVPDSKGDITRYYYYNQMADTINVLNKLTAGTPLEDSANMKLMNRFHNMILNLRGDFEFGFRSGSDFLKITYNLYVMTLYELIEVCLCDYTDYLKETVKSDNGTKSKRVAKSRMVVENALGIMRYYEDGTWKKIMTQMRSDGGNFLGLQDIDWSGAAGILGKHPTLVKVVGGIGITIAAIIAILWAIRKITYYFYSSRQKFSDYATSQAAILKANMSSEKEADAYAAQKKILDSLENAAAIADARIDRTTKAAEKAIHESNKEKYAPAELRAPISSAGGYELI